MTTVSSRYWHLAAFLLACAGVGVIVSTYGRLSPTWDEPAHLAAGLELLSRGAYNYEHQHPPLSRLAASLLPYLDGLRTTGAPTIWTEAEALLATAADPNRVITLARIGVLPFFLLLLAATWMWARHLFGAAGATAAVFLLVTLPPMLGHAGIAATDGASVATLTLAFFALVMWLGRPTRWRAVALGAAVGLTLISKFSAIPFLVVATVACLLARALTGTAARSVLPVRPVQWVLTVVAMLAVLWVGYGFGLVPMGLPERAPYDGIDRLLGETGWAHDMAYALVQMPIYPRFLASMPSGIWYVARHNAEGHLTFLLGELGRHGWWYYYPVALAVRTPLPLLLLGGGGLIAMVVAGLRQRAWMLLAPAAITLALLAFCTQSQINIGLRHVMAVYPLMAIGGAYALVSLLRLGWPGRVAVVALVVAQVASTILAYPNQFSYFNRLAGDHPERILISSDLDWGQDLNLLAAEMRQRQADGIWLAYNGSVDPALFIPGYRPLPPGEPTTGWVAISQFTKVTCRRYRWLDDYTPVTRVGASIWLYRIDEVTLEAAAAARVTDPSPDIGRCP